jgi:release factor glutamine methyltransferase
MQTTPAQLELYQSLCEELAKSLCLLPDKPEETIDSTLRALWCTAAGNSKSPQAALSAQLLELDAHGIATLRDLVARRISGLPLSHLTNRQNFMGLEMLAGPEALIPRKETELLGRVAIEHARDLAKSHPALLMIDVCTGSGNVALAVANRVDKARIFAADLSISAIELARRNAAHLQLHDRVEFRDGDLLAPFENEEFLGKVDLLTCNPPYINSAKVQAMPKEIVAHEPRLAFDGGSLGIGILMRLLQQAPRFLRSGGVLAFEVGLGQGPALVKRMKGAGSFKEVHTSADEAGAVRVIYARC